MYFNIITEESDFKYKFVLNFEIHYVNQLLYTYIYLTYFSKNTILEERKFVGALNLIDTVSKEKSDGINNYVLKNIEHRNKGYGYFGMAIFVDTSDENELEKFLNDPVGGFPAKKKLNRESSSFWKRLKCDKEKFEFLTKNSTVSGSGFQLLI